MSHKCSYQRLFLAREGEGFHFPFCAFQLRLGLSNLICLSVLLPPPPPPPAGSLPLNSGCSEEHGSHCSLIYFSRLPVYYRGYDRAQINTALKRYRGWGPEQRGFCSMGLGLSTEVGGGILVPNAENSSNSPLSGFPGGCTHWHDRRTHGPLGTESASIPPLSPWRPGSGTFLYSCIFTFKMYFY